MWGIGQCGCDSEERAAKQERESAATEEQEQAVSALSVVSCKDPAPTRALTRNEVIALYEEDCLRAKSTIMMPGHRYLEAQDKTQTRKTVRGLQWNINGMTGSK